MFGNLENGITRRSTTTVSTLPLAANRSGQFSRTITGPLTTLPFAGNTIPANRIDPVAARILAQVPLPQSSAVTDNYVFNSPSDQDTGSWNANIAAEVGPTSNGASGVYELLFGRGKALGGHWGTATDAVLGGWSVSPILSAASGSPLDLTVTGNPSNSNGSDRPNVVGEWELENPTADRWFNTDAFVAW